MTEDQNAQHRTTIPGVKRERIKVPEIIDTVEDWVCVQMQIPDDDEYIRMFYDLFDTWLGMWFNYQRDTVMGGARTAKIWRTARETIVIDNCTGNITMPACNPTPIGSIIMWPTQSTIPDGWLICDGESLLTSAYPDLFAVLGYTYGGIDDVFYLPNLDGRSPIGIGQVGAGQTYIEGTHYGSEQRTLLVGNLPPHQHNILGKDSSTAGTTARVMASSGTGSNANKISEDGAANGATSTPFDIVHPVLALCFIIRALDEDCETEVITGPPGPPGPTGPTGAPGINGECEDCGDTPPGQEENDVPPPPPGENTRCKVAQGVVDSLLDNYYIPLLDFWIDSFITEGLTALEVIDALRLTLLGQTAGAIAWPPSAIGLIGTIGSALFGAMVAAVNAAQAQNLLDTKTELNDPDVREELYCILYSVLNDEGDITAQVWSDFLQQLGDNDNFAVVFFWAYLGENIPLYVARTEAYITQGGAFDCADCGWCYTWDFVENGVDDWVINIGSHPGSETGGIDGTTIEIEIEFSPPAHITQVVMVAEGLNPGNTAPWTIHINDEHVFTGVFSNGQNFHNGNYEEVEKLVVRGTRSFNWGITDMILRGKNPNPFGSSNCD